MVAVDSRVLVNSCLIKETPGYEILHLVYASRYVHIVLCPCREPAEHAVYPVIVRMHDRIRVISVKFDVPLAEARDICRAIAHRVILLRLIVQCGVLLAVEVIRERGRLLERETSGITDLRRP